MNQKVCQHIVFCFFWVFLALFFTAPGYSQGKESLSKKDLQEVVVRVG
ncbi:MAG: hypothetical protein JSV50_16155 [Desulfobacteraceae bacterium]|nr:MAG: hypothetical protein JSV50_16155 [Desulfobacteraceae bacterium]